MKSKMLIIVVLGVSASLVAAQGWEVDPTTKKTKVQKKSAQAQKQKKTVTKKAQTAKTRGKKTAKAASDEVPFSNIPGLKKIGKECDDQGEQCYFDAIDEMVASEVPANI